MTVQLLAALRDSMQRDERYVLHVTSVERAHLIEMVRCLLERIEAQHDCSVVEAGSMPEVLMSDPSWRGGVRLLNALEYGNGAA